MNSQLCLSPSDWWFPQTIVAILAAWDSAANGWTSPRTSGSKGSTIRGTWETLKDGMGRWLGDGDFPAWWWKNSLSELVMSWPSRKWVSSFSIAWWIFPVRYGIVYQRVKISSLDEGQLGRYILYVEKPMPK